MIEQYLAELEVLAVLRSQTDEQLSAYRAAANAATYQRQSAAADRTSRLLELQRRLDALLARCRSVAPDIGPFDAALGEVDLGSDPVALLEELLARLEDALIATLHTTADLETERNRWRSDVAEREAEAASRRSAEAALLATAQATDRALKTLAIAGTLVTVAVAAATSSAIAVAAPALALAVSVYLAASRPNTLSRRWSSLLTGRSSAASHAANDVISADLGLGLVLFCAYGLAALIDGFSIARSGVGLAVALVFAFALVVRRLLFRN